MRKFNITQKYVLKNFFKVLYFIKWLKSVCNSCVINHHKQGLSAEINLVKESTRECLAKNRRSDQSWKFPYFSITMFLNYKIGNHSKSIFQILAE